MPVGERVLAEILVATQVSRTSHSMRSNGNGCFTNGPQVGETNGIVFWQKEGDVQTTGPSPKVYETTFAMRDPLNSVVTHRRQLPGIPLGSFVRSPGTRYSLNPSPVPK